MARAFFFAGARALLVSHSGGAVRIVGKIVGLEYDIVTVLNVALL